MARTSDLPARPLFEILLGFVGAILVIPLLWRVVTGLLSSGFVRKILVEALLVGATSLLTKEGTLDRLFGPKGETQGLLKSETEG